MRPPRIAPLRTARCLVLAITVLLGLAAPVLVAAPASAAGCYYTSCTDHDPHVQGCDVGPTTTTLGEFTVGSQATLRVELRYSSTCRAVWARATSTAAGAYGYTWLQLAEWTSRTGGSLIGVWDAYIEWMGNADSRWTVMHAFDAQWYSACLSSLSYRPTGPCTTRH